MDSIHSLLSAESEHKIVFRVDETLTGIFKTAYEMDKENHTAHEWNLICPKFQYLGEPAELTKIFLISDYWKDKVRELNVQGKTVIEVIQTILTFYSHATYRRLIGDHLYFEGFLFDEQLNGFKIILGS